MKAEAYCVKCKAKTAMAGAAESVLKNGRKAIKGKCPKCGTGMFKMIAGQGASSKPASRTAPKTETEIAPSGLLGGGWTLLG
jgi:ssDNA-binding Zn-finger/Zn-ribbon topoisomerase 1